MIDVKTQLTRNPVSTRNLPKTKQCYIESLADKYYMSERPEDLLTESERKSLDSKELQFFKYVCTHLQDEYIKHNLDYRPNHQ